MGAVGARTVILTRAFGFWFVCTGVNRETRTVGVQCGALMPHPEGFIKDHPTSYHLRGLVAFDESQIEFYPVVSWGGVVVYLWGWTHTSDRPLLKCEISTPSILRAVRAESGESKGAFDAKVQVLEQAGWNGNAHTHWCKWCHVDELEKEPGPAPGLRA